MPFQSSSPKPKWVLTFCWILAAFACSWNGVLAFQTRKCFGRKSKAINPLYDGRRTISKFGLLQHQQCHQIQRPVPLTKIYNARPTGSRNDLTGNEDTIDRTEQRRGFLILLTVPFAWGSYEPAVRYVYALDVPVPGFVFSFSYYLVAALALFFSALFTPAKGEEDSWNIAEKQQASYWPVREGVELGSYLFFGNALQLLGLETTPSDRAAVLLQLNTIFVPFLQAAFFVKDFSVLSKKTWLACLVALVGVIFMGLDGAESVFHNQNDIVPFASLNLSFGVGDFLIIAAAFVYSFHIIRLEAFARNVSAIRLAATKATTEASWTALTIASLVSLYSSTLATENDPSNTLRNFVSKQGNSIGTFFATMSSDLVEQVQSPEHFLPAIYATLWTGLVTVAYTIYAQTIGQRSVNAVTANLIFAFQPVCTAIFAYVLLGERLGFEGYVGAGLILGAVALASSPHSKIDTKKQ